MSRTGKSARKGRMPALFLGHGSPMNAIEHNAFRRGWSEASRRIPRPKAILCISAHWETRGTLVTGAEHPETIHDFYGFPRELFEVRYPAPGAPALARRAVEQLAPPAGRGARIDPQRGLDHGAWSVLLAMYPDADVPVAQLSLDTGLSPAGHHEIARRLAPLRDEGVLVLGSGNLVHNLGLIDFLRADGYDWAIRFDAEARRRIQARDIGALLEPAALGPDAALAVPTAEHYLPLLYVLALQGAGEAAFLFNAEVTMGSISMTCVQVGGAEAAIRPR